MSSTSFTPELATAAAIDAQPVEFSSIEAALDDLRAGRIVGRVVLVP